MANGAFVKLSFKNLGPRVSPVIELSSEKIGRLPSATG